LSKVEVLHLEPTDICNLACPLCARETRNDFNKRALNHLTITQIQKHFNNKKIKSLKKMFMCGNYGDPAAGKHTLDIYRWFRDINPNIVLGMNSSGSLQTTFWWHELGKLLNQTEDYVVFSIDGLEDTNSVYRVNSSWNKIMSNVEAFISAGGNAHWDMLVYKHNQHQVDACEQLARNLGFKWFRAKVSKRSFTERLEFPIGWQPAEILQGTIKCHALNDRSRYIDAQGRLHPCCWLGAETTVAPLTILDVKSTWKTSTPNSVCAKTCSSKEKKTNFSNQWQKEVSLC
jgi:hypothetical protein